MSSDDSDLSSEISELSLASDELLIGQLAAELQSKVAELKTEIHPELGPFLVRYADALLTKEEDNLNPLAGEREPEEAEAEAEGNEDLEVAWECFEQARLCFEKASDAQAASHELAFIHRRLGDLLSMRSAADAAADEYKKALSFVASDAHRTRAGVLMVLGQALLMAQKYEDGKEVYTEAETAFKAWKTSSTSCSEDLEIIEASLHEIQDALNDCTLALRSAVKEPKTSTVSKLDQKLGAGETTTGSFDKPASQQENKAVITLVPKRKTAPEGSLQERQSPDAKKTRLA